VAVQHRRRLFREGIAQLLGAGTGVTVVGMAGNDADLLQLCRRHCPSVAVIEAEVTDWDASRLVGSLRRSVPHLAVIGLTASSPTLQEEARARRSGMSALVPRSAGITGILGAVREASDPSIRRRVASIGGSSTPSTAPATVLTGRELEILSLVGAGLTSVAVSSRLQISHKTVENHKQRIFAKLGVQNQAHAVSVAMRTGLMRPDRVIDLAVGD
jgi:DNA-binding NarL/FixJ family response regulator